MILRTIVIATGLAGALGAAQFPAYSQQYMQRLGGAVAALEEVVTDFDTSAAGLGMARDAALAQMHGTAFVEARRVDMENTFQRYDALRHDLDTLQGQGPFMRAYHIGHMTDADIAGGAWRDFEPAMPLALTSLIFAAAGFVAGSFSAVAALRILRIGRRKAPLPA